MNDIPSPFVVSVKVIGLLCVLIGCLLFLNYSAAWLLGPDLSGLSSVWGRTAVNPAMRAARNLQIANIFINGLLPIIAGVLLIRYTERVALLCYPAPKKTLPSRPAGRFRKPKFPERRDDGGSHPGVDAAAGVAGIQYGDAVYGGHV